MFIPFLLAVLLKPRFTLPAVGHCHLTGFWCGRGAGFSIGLGNAGFAVGLGVIAGLGFATGAGFVAAAGGTGRVAGTGVAAGLLEVLGAVGMERSSIMVPRAVGTTNRRCPG
jgi:hypothetical protein